MGRIEPLYLLYVFLASAAGGLVQTATGFGFGIIVMLVFPLFLPIVQAAALSSLISLFHNAVMVAKNRRHVRLRAVWLPTVIYTAVSIVCIQIAKRADIAGLKAWFGLFLIAAALYFIFFSRRVRLTANVPTAVICSSISGAAGGFFGIGGPPMVPYYLAAVGDDKLAYLATIQMFFGLTNISGTAARALSGIMTFELAVCAVPGFAGLLLGTGIGMKIVNRIHAEQMKTIIYYFLAVAGLVTFLTNI